MFLTWLLFILVYISGLFHADQPEFKGGQEKLILFISNSIIYPEFAKQNCLQGTIQIRFKLNSKGLITDSKVQKGFGVDLDKEALRIIRLTSGKWTVPAGYDTTNSLVLPINFSLKDYKCEQRSRDDINASIAAYRAQQDLTKVLVNYYTKKLAGTHNKTEEPRIIQLKEELGYDEKYIDRLLRIGQNKLKQGDKEGSCDDFNLVRGLGSDKADKLIALNCW